MTTSTSAPVRIALYGHVSATPAALAKALADRGIDVAAAADEPAQIDCAIFAINPSAGIDPETIALWESFNDYLTPRIMVALALPGADLDFDDAVLLANRVFDQMVTPYLVLHGDDGTPAALISLDDLSVRNYIQGIAVISESDPEHRELVADFQSEYHEIVEASGEDAFAAGLLFPAIPVNIDNGIGLDVLKDYLDQLK
ncbi:unannotated protein [freshwater metagenome]|uniref:Unannotated protein n=1 Tax=freshwater metagenome TaxID=449393 RepID=A0A6J6KDZ4_9ZZZZ|nr:hypothetical protein [Actinomycetota bacterium]